MIDEPAWERLLTLARDHALAYRRSLPSRPVAPSASIEAVMHALDDGGGMPAEGVPVDQLLDELVHVASPGITAMSGPRFFGWVIGGTLAGALAADWMTSTWDQNAGTATGSPAATAFEATALRWIVALLGLPGDATGGLVTGAMSANFTALAAARDHVLTAAGWDVHQQGLFGAPAVRIVVGHERHDTIDKAVKLLGFGKQSMRFVSIDGQGRMSSQALRRELKQSDGPVIVCAQAGNVNSGAFDPLDEITNAVAEYRAAHGEGQVWLHIDGAFGLWARAAKALAPLAHGAELADSWATDAHKFLNVPYDCGIVLTRHRRAHRRAMAVQAPYLSSGADRDGAGLAGQPNPAAFTPELSRRARGFVLWAALRQLGARGVDELVTRCCAHARLLADKLAEAPGLSILNDVVLNQVVVKSHAPEGADPGEWTRALAVAIQNEGTCYPTPTLWRSVPALRFSVINADTTAEDILRSARAVIDVHRQRLETAKASDIVQD
jgi:glutamate/tyrosine decarboxylase-like PLP-dependent enzyme